MNFTKLLKPLTHRLGYRSISNAANKVKSGGSIGYNRLQDFYYDVIQEDLMAMKFQYPGKEVDATQNQPYKRESFQGPRFDEDGKIIHKKGSIRPKRPSDLLIGPNNIPELEKIEIQLMMKEAITNKYALLSAYLMLQSITGEKATTVVSKSNVAVWKLRKGQPVGCQVTLTGGAMYSFLDKLVEVVLPRIKEWEGFSSQSGDGTGNLALGFPPSAVGLFPDLEIIYDMIPNISGFNIVFNTTSYRDPNARLLMSALQLPIVNKRK
ncbi:ribosomal protein L5 [Neoconidiobolus thromboides FSU 785]|nr:ribosomal protein L5 [Neoconidiobolus thromboides FSU 785]